MPAKKPSHKSVLRGLALSAWQTANNLSKNCLAESYRHIEGTPEQARNALHAHLLTEQAKQLRKLVRGLTTKTTVKVPVKKPAKRKSVR